MPTATRDSGSATPTPKGWHQIQELQRQTDYHLEQARAARERLYGALQVLKQAALYGTR